MTFKGRASRSEYWYFCLVFVVAVMLVPVLAFVGLPAGVTTLLAVVTFVGGSLAGLSVGVRRMHDTNRPGWWLLVPFASFVFLLMPGDAGANSYNQP